MGMDISVRPEQVTENEDRRWAATRKGFDTCRPIMLDLSLFNANHLTAKGAIPSGTVLGKVTVGGKYGPYDADASNGLQTAAGFLFSTLSISSEYALATAPDQGAALYWEGVVNQDYLPVFASTTDGELDAAGRADMAAHIRFEGTDL